MCVNMKDMNTLNLNWKTSQASSIICKMCFRHRVFWRSRIYIRDWGPQKSLRITATWQCVVIACHVISKIWCYPKFTKEACLVPSIFSWTHSNSILQMNGFHPLICMWRISSNVNLQEKWKFNCVNKAFQISKKAVVKVPPAWPALLIDLQRQSPPLNLKPPRFIKGCQGDNYNWASQPGHWAIYHLDGEQTLTAACAPGSHITPERIWF